MTASLFSPFEALFDELLPFVEQSSDGSHDLSHLTRVWNNAKTICAAEGGDTRLLAAAVILHDCVVVEKDSPLRDQASRLAAEKAGAVLSQRGWTSRDISLVTEAIRTHSYSSGLTPTSIEGKILQDADRLDAIGFVGIARCFYTAGRMGSRLYNNEDPPGTSRPLKDREFALDHFPLKLLRLAGGFQTAAGARMAAERHNSMKKFYDSFLEEVTPSFG